MTETKKGENRWLIVFGSVIIGLLSGLIYTWSIFVKPLSAEYGWSVDQAALVGNTMTALYCIGIAIGGLLLPKLGAKKTSLYGSIMFGVGTLVSGFVKVPVVMFVTYSIVAGLGVGFLYAVGMFVASAWFPEKRGFIMSLYLTAFGLALTFFTAPINMLLQKYGVQAAFVILGIIYLVVLSLVSIFLMKTPSEEWLMQHKVEIKSDDKSETMESVTVAEGLKTPQFWLFFAAYFLLIFPYAFISSYSVVYLEDQVGLLSEQAVAIVSTMGIGAAAGRIMGGVLVDRIGCKKTYATFCTCSSLGCILMLTTGSYASMTIAFIFLAAGFGGRVPVYGVHPIQQFGPKYSSSLYGFGVPGTSISMILAPLVTAAIRNRTGSFNGAAVVAIVIAIVGMCCICVFTPRVTPFMKKNGITE